MVRLKLSFINGKGEWLSTHAQTFDCDSMSAWTSKIRPGGWYELWSFDLGDSSVALGIGFMEPSCKVNMNRGFIEFNPNKVAGDKRFWRLLEKLAPCVSHARLKRFDLAYDLPTSRLDCRLSKDRRMYKSVISNGITEYLGVKNTPGYVKVYDKAAEMHLSGVPPRSQQPGARQHRPRAHQERLGGRPLHEQGRQARCGARGTATTLHRRGRIAGGLDDVL